MTPQQIWGDYIPHPSRPKARFSSAAQLQANINKDIEDAILGAAFAAFAKPKDYIDVEATLVEVDGLKLITDQKVKP